MSKEDYSREFSICLLVDDATSKAVSSIRESLPESPYRDDPPHLTLLRGITTPSEMSDKDLLDVINSSLSIQSWLPFTETFSEVSNKGNEMYSQSGLLLIEPSVKLLHLRQLAITKLTELGFSIELSDRNSYIPHITVRLGVPLEGEQLDMAKDSFLNQIVTLNQWVIFRVVQRDTKRLMHAVYPT